MELFHQIFDELEEDEVLGFGTGVGWMSVGIKATDIGDADGVGVMSWTMSTDLFQWSARVNAAVLIDYIVIAYVEPAEALVVSSYGFHGAVGIGTCGCAVYDDFGDFAHFNIVDCRLSASFCFGSEKQASLIFAHLNRRIG